MKAMILAAGKGTRVRPLTYEMPKPMIPILGKPVMEYLLESLASFGFREVMVNLSYLPEQIEDYFGDGRRWGVEIGYSFEGSIVNGEVHSQALGSAGGIKRIQDFGGFFDSTFLVACGDAIIDVDLSLCIETHRRSGAIASLIAKPVPLDQVSNYGVVVADDRGRITSFQEKPSPAEAKSNLVNTGVYIFEPEVIDLIPSNTEFDIGSQLFPLLVQRGLPFFALTPPFNWIDIGKVSDFWEVHQRVMDGEVPAIRRPGRQIRPGIWVGLNVSVDWEQVHIEGPVYIGSGTRIEAGSRIVGPTWIGHGCQIMSGAQVLRSILFAHTRLGSSARLEDVVASGVYCVDKTGQAFDMAELLEDRVVEDARSPLIRTPRPQVISQA